MRLKDVLPCYFSIVFLQVTKWGATPFCNWQVHQDKRNPVRMLVSKYGQILTNESAQLLMFFCANPGINMFHKLILNYACDC